MSSVTNAFRVFGVDLKRLVKSIVALPRFIGSARRYSNAAAAVGGLPLRLRRIHPCLLDADQNAGILGGAYFHQDLLIAQHIHKANPERHIDVGSRTDGFVAHVASYRDIEVIDIRPLCSDVSRIKFLQCDVMQGVPPALLSVTDSLSCLHALEHFGLGRYGDPIDPMGHIKGLRNLVSMLKPGGTIYLGLPLGPTRVEFNAHRVFSVQYILELLQQNALVLEEFNYIDDAGRLHRCASAADGAAAVNFGVYHGCAVLVAKKLALY